MRKWLYRIHLYGGLFCFPYLIIFGFSSLHFNHRFSFAEPEPEKVTRHETVSVGWIEDNVRQAEVVRDSLRLMGWPLPWQTSRDSSGTLRFGLARPGKDYTIHHDPDLNLARIEETRFGFWRVFNSLHAMGNIPNSRFSGIWPWYTEFCTIFVLFAGISGIVLWAQGRREKISALVTLLAVSGVSLLLMLYVWLRG